MYRISVKITPNSKKNAIVSETDGVWSIKVACQPIEGKANTELIKYLSKVLDTAKSNIVIDKGQTSKTKIILIEGLDEDQIVEKLRKEIVK